MEKQTISLSFGRYSNFTSTHFWNLQNEALKNEEYLESINTSQFLDSSDRPRALLFDMKQDIVSCIDKMEDEDITAKIAAKLESEWYLTKKHLEGGQKGNE